jgi:GNAT superfamily N-acetyltransferase
MAKLRVAPLTPERWGDFEALFGPRGACGGCWCMTPRLSSAQYERQKGAGNRRAMQRLVSSGTVPGVLGYLGKTAVAWCAIEPRASFPRLGRSRVLKPVDDLPVWSIACFFVHKDWRGRGLSVALIDGAVRHARRCGAKIVEAYPVEPEKHPMPAVFAYTGLASAFRRAGFAEVARRSPTRPIMRRAT